MKGRLIVLEGLDGSGKTTQGNILKEKLEEKGFSVLFTREPGGTEISERLRKIILNKEFTEMHPKTEMYLYAAARCQLVHQVLKPALENGVIVILDRFVLSSVAYQGYGRELGEQLVLDINAPAVDGLAPDLTVLFDMKRKDERLEREKDRIELDGTDFFERIYNGYMTAYDRDTTLVIDGGKSIEEIAEAVWKRVEELI